jgi:predicted transcriptional regulator
MVRNIQIGKFISGKISDKNLQMEDVAKQLDIPESVLSLMLKNDDLGCNVLFKICKILDYDFFGHYSYHLNNHPFSGKGKTEFKIAE